MILPPDVREESATGEKSSNRWCVPATGMAHMSDHIANRVFGSRMRRPTPRVPYMCHIRAMSGRTNERTLHLNRGATLIHRIGHDAA